MPTRHRHTERRASGRGRTWAIAILAVATLAGLGTGLGSALGRPAAASTASPAPASTTPVTAPTVVTDPAGYGPSQLVFEDSFPGTTLDGSKWVTYVTSNDAHGQPWNSDGNGGSGLDNPSASLFSNLEYDLPSQVRVDNGLVIQAAKEPTPGMIGTTPHTYDWRSGIVSTYGKFEFTGGYVQIVAKMPPAAVLWPSFWMLPGPDSTESDASEVDVFEGGFMANGVDPTHNFAWHLHTANSLLGQTTNVGTDLSAGYHTYGLKWVPGSELVWYLDGKEVGQITAAQGAIPTQPMELVMNLAVFNGISIGSDASAASDVSQNYQLAVRDVRVYQ